VVKAEAGRAPVRVARGLEMGQGGAGEERWEEGMPRHPFIGLKGEQAAGHQRGTCGGGGAP
jgi:hypothetical protein